MNVKKFLRVTITILGLVLGVLADVNAASISVKCETRSTTRSKISVDGSGVSGSFYAIVLSGGVYKYSKVKSAVSGEVEFDFDSNPYDISAGATAIPANYIKNKTVTGYIRKAVTNAWIGAMTATCVAK